MTKLGGIATLEKMTRSWPSFVAKYRLTVGYLIILCSFAMLLPALDAPSQGDVKLYRNVANDLLEGRLPYRDRVFEYPPYVIPIVLLPRTFSDEDYTFTFSITVLVIDWAIKVALLIIGLREFKGVRGILPVLYYSLAVVFLRAFYLQRYDVWPAVFCLIAFWMFSSRRYFISGLAIAIAVGLKVYPVVFLPVLLYSLFGKKAAPNSFLA